MAIKSRQFAFVFLIVALLFLANFAIFAQTVPSAPPADPALQQQQAELQKQLQEIEAQIAQYQNELKSVQGEKNTLQNKIKQLQKQASSLTLQIKATTLRINNLASQINATQDSIDQNLDKMGALKKEIGNFLQLIYERDMNSSFNFIYLALNNSNLSDILSEVENYSQISQALASLLEQTNQITDELNREQDTLSQQKDDANNLLSIQSLQRQQLADSVGQQSSLLTQTKGKESNYQNIITDAQKRAQEIRTRLYQLLGVSNQITFGEAVQIAQWVSGQTGVRAAFLLAVLTQESNLGKNVGTCNRAGDPPSKSWKVVMKPERDQQPFLQITQELGMDPDTTPVSCPMRDKNGNQVGWGGAMGPAQFIPSTWMGYRERVSAMTGKPANPWNIKDAFIAAAIKLGKDGATSQSGEWAAAMKYFSGSTNTKYRFYGDNVVAQADRYQSDINELN